ncbi:MAG: response regulator [Nitrospirae bacterium]|nr:response regulator [Nitrospirota bacterium]
MPARVLVVEDNEKNRRLLRDVLQFHGFEVIEAVNGEEGITMARTEKPDIILMDMQMPVMDGFTAIRTLKNDPDLRQIKIVSVTSFAMAGDREKILAAGADGYVAKPIDTRELPAMLKELSAGLQKPMEG